MIPKNWLMLIYETDENNKPIRELSREEIKEVLIDYCENIINDKVEKIITPSSGKDE